MFRKRIESCVEFVSRRGGKIGLCDFPVHFVFKFVKKRRAFGMNFHLQVDEQVEILVDFFRMLFHKLFERFSGNVFDDDRPFSVDFRYFEKFRNVKSRFFHSRLIQRLVENVRFGIVLVEKFDDFVAVAIYGFRGTNRYYFIEFHCYCLLSDISRACRSKR